ncbi:MAG: hypothetical protein JMDDDDMK_03840 [Acidobacteria bacterium]|nr:hypothetical protein [Acidobacteriota bacterium]
MARGWESKSVEDQMEEARRSQVEAGGRIQSPEEKERERRIESLRLERSRLTEQLDRARSAAHQRMIQQSLEAIEAEIAALIEGNLKA